MVNAPAAHPETRARALLEWAQRVGPADPMTTHEHLLTEALLIENDQPALAAEMLGEAAWIAVTIDADRALDAARRAHSLGPGAPNVALALAMTLVVAGRAEEGDAVATAALASLDRDAGSMFTLSRSAVLSLWREHYDDARRLLERAITCARDEHNQVVLANALDTHAALDYRTGKWPAARARSAEALRIAEAVGGELQRASCLTTLARLDAVSGREADCRRRVAEALDLADGNRTHVAYAVSARGLLALGLDDPEEAIRELGPLRAAFDDRAEPMVVQWVPDLLEALARAGRNDDWSDVFAWFEDSTRGAGATTWTRAVAARCRGLGAGGRDFDGAFHEALELHSKTPTPFERARTELCYGERLRRARRRADANGYLLAALATFERLGAAPWATRARRELGRGTRLGGAIETQLTAHEIEVVSLVVRGLTNREAAAALFVSPKTIDYHLVNVYRKLDVRSRTELTRLMLGR
ncbi:MAG: LuxR C-terminal-related transcriptional regulator [Actinomycetota bacterium]